MSEHLERARAWLDVRNMRRSDECFDECASLAAQFAEVEREALGVAVAEWHATQSDVVVLRAALDRAYNGTEGDLPSVVQRLLNDTRAAAEACTARIRDEAYRAGQIRMRERAANIHENIDPSCDHEPRGCGAGAMGAVLRFRGEIRFLEPEPLPSQEGSDAATSE